MQRFPPSQKNAAENLIFQAEIQPNDYFQRGSPLENWDRRELHLLARFASGKIWVSGTPLTLITCIITAHRRSAKHHSLPPHTHKKKLNHAAQTSLPGARRCPRRHERPSSAVRPALNLILWISLINTPIVRLWLDCSHFSFYSLPCRR